MTKGNFTVAFLDTTIDKLPEEAMRNIRRQLPGDSQRRDVPQYNMMIMGDDNIGRVHPIPKADAVRLIKKIVAFKKSLRAEMMAAAGRFKKGKR